MVGRVKNPKKPWQSTNIGASTDSCKMGGFWHSALRKATGLDQSELQRSAAQLAEMQQRGATRMQRLRRRLARVNWLFLATVVLPTTLAAVYFGLIASDVYISESRFIVRSPQKPLQTGFLGTLIQGTSLSRNLDDTYAVQDFIVSRDALKDLEAQLQIKKAFSDPNIDFVSRFGGLDWDDSFEALHRYYQRRVSVLLDTGASISVLRVSAFTPQDAQKINESLLRMSERLVNHLSDRGRQDILRYAASEVDVAERKAKDAALALAEFRSEKGVVDPERQSVAQLQQLGKLQDELIATKTQIAQIRALTPDNPQIPVLQTRQNALQREFNAEVERISGRGGSLTNIASGYIRLALEREFADKQLAAAMAFLESVRSDAQRQQLYLERIVQPHQPDYAVEPRRVRSILVTLVVGLIAWGILSLLLASIREHVD
jgi:capsular polysaccharide transport system permease protein